MSNKTLISQFYRPVGDVGQVAEGFSKDCMYKVAVLDDSRAWCQYAEVILSPHVELGTFEHINDFLQKVDQFDLVMIDYALFVSKYDRFLDGYDLICHLRSTLSDPPLLVLVSAFADDDLKEQATAADACLEKSEGMERILPQILGLLESRTRHTIPEWISSPVGRF